MKYMMLIYGQEGGFGDMPEDQQQAVLKSWFDYTENMEKAGVLVAGDALQPTASATSVRVRDGKTLTTDGPFAETKEQLGGYYLMEVPSLDEALDWAARCPGAPFGTIEVRPVMTFDQ
ncbi:MAG TPA: YciI family protein [Miltoncostaeaceae bacterium]|nr:YciI family protein [Miltoncostaeaceae bacterium]